MNLLYGKLVVSRIEREIKEELANIKSIPKLVTILVGNNPSSETYVKMKVKACIKKMVSIPCRIILTPILLNRSY